jgi:hypothetical protein
MVSRMTLVMRSMNILEGMINAVMIPDEGNSTGF